MGDHIVGVNWAQLPPSALVEDWLKELFAQRRPPTKSSQPATIGREGWARGECFGGAEGRLSRRSARAGAP